MLRMFPRVHFFVDPLGSMYGIWTYTFIINFKYKSHVGRYTWILSGWTKTKVLPEKNSRKTAVEWHGFCLWGVVIGVTPQQPPIPLGLLKLFGKNNQNVSPNGGLFLIYHDKKMTLHKPKLVMIYFITHSKGLFFYNDVLCAPLQFDISRFRFVRIFATSLKGSFSHGSPDFPSFPASLPLLTSNQTRDPQHCRRDPSSLTCFLYQSEAQMLPFFQHPFSNALVWRVTWAIRAWRDNTSRVLQVSTFIRPVSHRVVLLVLQMVSSDCQFAWEANCP